MKSKLFRSNFPFDPVRVPFFYGWVILMAGTLGFCFSLPGHSAGISPFTDKILEVLSISRVQYSFAYMMGTLASAATLPWGGRQFDRYGARKMGFFSLILLGGVLLLFSQWIEWVGEEFSATWVGVGFMFLFFYLMRFFAQGMLTMITRTMIVKWFFRKRNIVSAITSSFQSLSYGMSPVIFGTLSAMALDWKDVWVWIGTFLICAASPFAWLFFRDNPEACGLTMDGQSTDVVVKNEPVVEAHWTAKEVVITPFFWTLVMGMIVLNFSNSGMTLHLDSIGRSMEISDKVRSLLFHMAWVAIIGNFVASWGAKKFGILRMFKGQMLTQIVASFLFPFLGSHLGWWAFILFNGLSWGSWGVLNALLWAHFYGRKHLGSIMGWTMFATVIASSLGPITYSSIYGQTGSYGLSTSIMAVFSLLVFLCLQLKIFTINQPTRTL